MVSICSVGGEEWVRVESLELIVKEQDFVDAMMKKWSNTKWE